MTVKITIIGLGRTGSSFGLALGEHRQILHRIGHDKDYTIGQEAQKKGVIDQYVHNLHEAVKDADVVLLTTPFHQILGILEEISADLKEGTLVLETSHAKAKIAEWMKTYLPQSCSYVGLTPSINPAYLTDEERMPRGDLYKSSLMAICAPTNTPAEAYKLATDIVNLVGARPLFSDLLEVDGLLAEAEIIPQLISSALVRAMTLQPGWQEARKFAGKNFWDIGAPSGRSSSAQELAQTWKANEQNLERLLDNVIQTLQIWREQLHQGDLDQVVGELNQAQQDFRAWQTERQKSEWNQPVATGGWDQVPTSSERLGGLFGMNLFNKKKKGDDK
ncbi:MAG: prephenate dehydrogenase [Anaerolineales bacterium]